MAAGDILVYVAPGHYRASPYARYIGETPRYPGFMVLPTMAVRTKAGAAGRALDEAARAQLWNAIRAVSSFLYGALRYGAAPGEEFQLHDTRDPLHPRMMQRTPRAALRRRRRREAGPPELRPAYHPPGLPHLRDAVRVSESRRDLRSTVTHDPAVYWAYFEEFGSRLRPPHPKWLPAARWAREEVVKLLGEELRALLQQGEVTITGKVPQSRGY